MRYICQLCGYVYDDEKESVPFAELPDDWTCPLCRAPKSMFKAEEAPDMAAPDQAEAVRADDEPASIKVAADADGDALAGLSAGQLAALCGNLARGCEKQDRLEESALFIQLANAFTAQVEPVGGVEVQALSDLLLGDAQRYASAREAAKDANDRGALRVITWGERITNMLSYLVGRYLSEGEAFLEGTEVWVCTVCGFVYVGDEAPELCPVCKVPAWKFEKVERRAS